MCSIQNPLFTCYPLHLIQCSLSFSMSPISKRRWNWKRNWRAFQEKDHPIYAFGGVLDFFVVVLFFNIFFCWFGVFLNPTSTDVYCLQSPEDSRQGRLVLVLHGNSNALLLFSGSHTYVWSGPQPWFGQRHLPGGSERCQERNSSFFLLLMHFCYLSDSSVTGD